MGLPLVERPISNTLGHAMFIASHDLKPAPKLQPRFDPDWKEPFLWMGTNYLLKMTSDMKYSPLPVAR